MVAGFDSFKKWFESYENEAYYEFLKSGRIVINSVPILAPTHIIPFKEKAWLHLLERKRHGEHIDSKNIKKHKNDVFRMSVFLTEGTKVESNDEIHRDMEEFIKAMKEEKVDLNSIGVRGMSYDELIGLLENTYL